MFTYCQSTLLQRAVNRACAVGRRTATTNAFGSTLPDVVSNEGWDAAWRKGVTPWETGKPSPFLARLLEDKTGALDTPLPRGRALVPGCGSGSDAIAFSKAGWDSTGLDLSETAITLCKERETREGLDSSLRLQFLVGDFFSFQSSGPFDVIFDYTFVSALHPSLWTPWANRAYELLRVSG
jgi:methyl halide transferase